MTVPWRESVGQLAREAYDDLAKMADEDVAVIVANGWLVLVARREGAVALEKILREGDVMEVTREET